MPLAAAMDIPITAPIRTNATYGGTRWGCCGGMVMTVAFLLVGVGRFELPASWSQTKRSAWLSYTPLTSP